MALTIQKFISLSLTHSLAAVALALSLTACETIALDQPVLGGEAVSDSPLVAEVKKALKNNPQTTMIRVKVSADEDVIILRGTVDNQAQITAAEQIAASVRGVRVVSNHLYTYH